MAILIFERSADITTRLIDLVNDAGTGMQVYYTSSFADAIILLQQKELKVALLDLAIGSDLSVHLLQAIKKKNKNTVVIILYTYKDETILQQCRDNNADFLFDKFADFEKIPAVIRSVSENHES
jgi:DNA-binding NtrC family response regulator